MEIDSAAATLLSDLPTDWRQAAQTEIAPGEKIRWCSRPGSLIGIASSIYRAANMIIIGVIIFGFGGLLFMMAGPPNPKDAGPLWGLVGTGIAFAPMLCLAYGIFLIVSERRRAKNTFYVITDRRLLIMAIGARTEVTVYGPDQIHNPRQNPSLTDRATVLFFPTMSAVVTELMSSKSAVELRMVQQPQLALQCLNDLKAKQSV